MKNILTYTKWTRLNENLNYEDLTFDSVYRWAMNSDRVIRFITKNKDNILTLECTDRAFSTYIINITFKDINDDDLFVTFNRLIDEPISYITDINTIVNSFKDRSNSYIYNGETYNNRWEMTNKFKYNNDDDNTLKNILLDLEEKNESPEGYRAKLKNLPDTLNEFTKFMESKHNVPKLIINLDKNKIYVKETEYWKPL